MSLPHYTATATTVTSASSSSSFSSSSASSDPSSWWSPAPQFELYIAQDGSVQRLSKSNWDNFIKLFKEFFASDDDDDGIEYAAADRTAPKKRRLETRSRIPCRRPTFVVGNGLTISATAEYNVVNDLPKGKQTLSWNEVVDKMLQTLHFSKDIVDNSNAVQKAELIAQQGALHSLKTHLVNNVESPPILVHHFLSYLLHSHGLGGGHVLTTNYDCVLDKAMLEQRVSAKEPVPIFISVHDAIPVGDNNVMDSLPLQPPLGFDSHHVVLHKIHGSFHQEESKVNPQPTNSPPVSSDYYPRLGITDIVISESDYRAALLRLINDSTSSARFACRSSLLVVMGKGMYWEDLTPNFIIMGTKTARVNAWRRFLENRTSDTAAADRQWAAKFLPSSFSGIYVCTIPPNKKEVANLLNMGLLTLIVSPSPNSSKLFWPIANFLSLRMLFPEHFNGFYVGAQKVPELRLALKRYKNQNSFFAPRPKILVVGVIGEGTFIDVGDSSFITSTCRANQIQLRCPTGAGFVVASTAANMLTRADNGDQCALVSVFPHEFSDAMLKKVRHSKANIDLSIFDWKGLPDYKPPESDAKERPTEESSKETRFQPADPLWPPTFGTAPKTRVC